MKQFGTYCYHPVVFGKGETCPDYDGSEPMNPKCRKYSKTLRWNKFGRCLKLDQCRKDDKEII